MRKHRIWSFLILIMLVMVVCGWTEKENEALDFQDNVTILYQDESCCVELVVGLDYDSGGTIYCIRCENRTDEVLQCTFQGGTRGIMLNGSIVVDGKASLMVGPGKRESTTALSMSFSEAELLLGNEKLEQLSGEIVIEGTKISIQKQVEAKLNIGTERSFLWEPFEDALAESQVLAENEEFKLTLLGLGKVMGTGYQSLNLRGVLCLENKTDRECPFSIDAVVVNGITIECINTSDCFVRPFLSSYLSFEVKQSSFQTLGIASIHDISLLILTDLSENQDYTANIFDDDHRSLSGGRLYPLALSKTGSPIKQTIEGDSVFEMDGIRIVEAGQSAEENGCCNWYYWVYNDTQKEIAVSSERWSLGEEENREAILSSLDYSIVAPGAQGLIHAIGYFEKPFDQWPEFEMRLFIQTAGGGDLLGSVSFPAPRKETIPMVVTEDYSLTYMGQSQWDEERHQWFFAWENHTDRDILVSWLDMEPSLQGADVMFDAVIMRQGRSERRAAFYSADKEIKTDLSFRVQLSDRDSGEILYTSELFTIGQNQ